MATAPLRRILRRAAPEAIRRLTLGEFPGKNLVSDRINYANRATLVTVTQTKVSDASKHSIVPPVTIIKSSADESPPAGIDPNGVNVTASCAARIHELASKRPDASSVYLRVYVDAGGCSGFQYKFELESEDSEDEDQGIDEEEDVVFEKDGSRVVIDQSSLELIKGSTVDFVREMIRSSFTVVGNPQSESACGCGSSFAVKSFEANPAID